jgi:hypothetical protein
MERPVDRGAELPSATYYVIHFNNGNYSKQVGFI